MNDNLPTLEKAAVIFHGIIGGMDGRNGIGSPSNIEDCAKTIKYNILSRYDCDIFAHSWSISQVSDILNIYDPTSSLFQPQEYFGLSSSEISSETIEGQLFRSISRYTSFERAMELKRQYEITNNFRYKWVIALRYDLVFYSPINFSELDPQYMYISSEPHWDKDGIINNSVFHDVVFLSSSEIMDKFSTFGDELRRRIYNGRDIHVAVCQKILALFGQNTSMVKHYFKRYQDVEIYRLIIYPEQNVVGHAYGALETKARLEELINKINNESNGKK